MSKGKKKEMNKLNDTRILDEDMWVPPIKQRRRFSPDESHILEREYASNSSPTQEKIQQIANSINTPRKIVTTWFQNRRAKNKRKEKIRMQENSMRPFSSVTPTTTEIHAPANPSTSFDSKDINLVYKNHSLKHGNGLPDELNNTYTLNDTSNTTNPSLLLSSLEFAHLYRTRALDQHSMDQTSHQPFFSIHHPSTLVLDNNSSSMRQQCTQEPYPSYSFEETELLYSNAIGDKHSYIPFYRSNTMTMDSSFSSSSHTCIKPTDLLLEYYNEGRSLLNIHEPDNIMANNNTNNDMENTINSSSAVCYEELMLMASLDVPQKDQ